MTARPLVGEPLALDLVNTRWVDHGRTLDLFDEPSDLHAWLQEHELAEEHADATETLRHTRAVLRRSLEDPGAPAEHDLNAVLGHGALRHTLRDGSVHENAQTDPGWAAAWHAAHNYLDLVRRSPHRIRRCAHPDCVLYFFDISRNGTRRWCSMDGCGSRVKAARHYRRNRLSSP